MKLLKGFGVPTAHCRTVMRRRSLLLQRHHSLRFHHFSTVSQQQENNIQPKPPSKTTTKTSRAISQLINKQPTWSPHLEATLSPLTQNLSKTTLIQTLHLIRSPSNALHFFNWAYHHRSFPHDDQTYFTMLQILAQTRNLNAARNLLFGIIPRLSDSSSCDRFFNTLIRSYGRAGLLSESFKIFSKMKEIGIRRSVFSFNSLFSVLLRRGRTVMVKKLYDEMRSTDGIDPDLYTFNILIRGFCLNSMADEGFRFFKEMSRSGINPDIVTYNTLVDGLCRAGKVRIAHNLLKGMQKKESELNPNVVTYTTLIRGYCEKQLIMEALEAFDEMIDRGLKPNVVTYNTLIQGLCEAQKLDKANEVLQSVIQKGEFKPDTCTFNTMINAHCNGGRLDEATKVFDKMSEFKVKPDSATYSVLIRSLCLVGDFQRAEKLFDVLAEKEILLKKDGCVPLVAAYNPMFEYLCEVGKTEKADKVFRQLLKRGTQDPPSFNTLIFGHCKEGSFGAAYEILVLMLKRDFMPAVGIYDSLIDGFLRKGESTFALKTLERMLRSDHLPKTSAFHSILGGLIREGRAQEACKLVMLMLERRIRQNINLSTDTVLALFQSGLGDKAFELIGLLYSSGYSVKLETLVSSLSQENKFLEARELLLFSLEKNQSLEIEIYSTTIMGLCENQRTQEAFSLFYQLVEKGQWPSLSCLKNLEMLLKADGKSKRADFVSKQMTRIYQEQ